MTILRYNIAINKLEFSRMTAQNLHIKIYSNLLDEMKNLYKYQDLDSDNKNR